MRTCHACQRELDASAIVTGKCPHCGAVLRKLAQRTIADPRPREAADPNKPIELITDESVELEITDTDKGGATIELSHFFDVDEYQQNKPPSTELSGQTIPDTSSEPSPAEPPKSPTIPDRNDLTIDITALQAAQAAAGDKPKTPTVADRNDMTMEFQSASSLEPPEKRTRRSTHTLESDKTIDLSMSPAEVRQLDSQWRGTFDLGARQGQTIRQNETISGFRSSLPVKSRYVREKRKADTAPPKSLAEVPDYELLDIIGEGGMGVVYAAHQSSIARTVAVKMLKPSAKVREEQRDKFISEAVVTGELDHPNIVPIYDLGSNDEGALFYSMKRVRGTPWDKVIHQKQLDENLSILLRVADAVAFAHAGGVIHRDLKPENVMLGDYGEVLVMDWGLARITPEFAHVDAVYQSDSLGGTPAYMSPEMAKGPVEAINKTSDIYLLGAILYEIIGGVPPHSGRDVMQCLMAASQNRIDPIRYDGELKEIALKAMATQQDDRYPTVKEFQEAVRTYQSHSESLVLSAHANQNLQKARAANDYQLYARALYGFQESLTLWDANHRARLLLTETQRDYAKSALDKGDLDLAASLLDMKQPEHQALMKRIDKARAERNARQRRLRMAKLAVAGLIAAIVTTVTTAFFIVRGQKNVAVAAKEREAEQRLIAEAKKKEADEQRAEAEKQTGIAVKERTEAERQSEIARQQEAIAKQQTIIAQQEEEKAKKAKEAEEYEAYVAQIGLANAKIEENAYDVALQLLDASQRDLRNWEWGRLAHMCQLSAANYKAGSPVNAVAYSPLGDTIASGDLKGMLTVRDVKTGAVRFEAPHGQAVLSVAFSPDGRQIATGSTDTTIHILDAADGQLLNTLKGHADGVVSVRFSPDGSQLVSGSFDKTARLWDIVTETELQTLKGHNGYVWDADFSRDGSRIVTAGQDGKAIVWQKGALDFEVAKMKEEGLSTEGLPEANPRRYARITEFTGHNGAVYSARFSHDGQLVATGGYDKLVLVWNPDDVQPVDIAKRIDRLPDGKVKYARLAGHDGAVRSVAFSPNDKLVVSGSEDNSLRVWDVETGQAMKALRGHGSIVRACSFSPDGQVVLSGGDDESTRLWDVKGYEEVRVLHATVLSGHDNAVLSAQFSRDGARIVTASLDRTAGLWDAATGAPLKRFVEGHEYLVSGVVFYQDGKHLATGAGDNSVRVWDRAAGTQVAMLTPTGGIGTLAVSPDSRWLATGSPGNDVTLWNAQTEAPPLGTLGGHEAEVSALAFSPNGRLLVSGDVRGKLRVWRLADGPQVQPAKWVFERELVGHNGSISAIRFTPDSGRLVTASGDHTCAQWDLATGAELRELVLKHADWVSWLDLSADGRYALTTCDDGIARLWRLADAAPIASVKSAGRPFNSGGFSPDGSTAVLASSEDKLVHLWNVSIAQAGVAADAAQASNTELLLDFNKLGGEVWTAMFAPDGRHVLTIGGNDATLWDASTRRPVVRFSPHGAVAAAVVSPNGKLVATGSWDHSAKIWDIETGRALRKLDGGHAGYVNSVEFSPDGSELLTASDDYTARLWNVETGQPTGVVFQGHTARVIAATFSPDGTRVLTVSGDKTARLWDRASGNPIGEPFTGHKWEVFCGKFSADGQRIITGSRDKTAIIWDVATRQKQLVLEGHTSTVTSAAFSPDGTRAITGSQDYTAKLWDATVHPEFQDSAKTQQAKEILSLPGHTQDVTSVSFSPDGLRVLTASRDGKAIIWLANDWRGATAEKKVAGAGR